MTIDSMLFESAVIEAERLEAQGTPSKAVDVYLRAAEWYRGDLLPESYDAWVLVQRDRLRTKFVRTAVRGAELLVALGRHDEAIEVATRALVIEPLSEAAHRSLVSAHLADGDLAAARRSMATCEVLLGEIGGIADPATEVMRRRVARRTS